VRELCVEPGVTVLAGDRLVVLELDS
jgi:hypothetical protein